MKNGQKALIIIFVFFGLLIPLVVKSCGSNDYSNINMEAQKYTMDVEIDEYGDMHVVETIVIDNYKNMYNNYFYKEIAYNKNNMFTNDSSNVASLNEDVRLVVSDYRGIVYDSDSGYGDYPDHFASFSNDPYNNRDERGYRLYCETVSSEYCDMVFYYNRPGFATITTFTYEYTIEGVVTQYNDISEFNWVLLGYQPFKFSDININITLPEGDYDIKDEKTFFHGTNMAKRKFVDTNKIQISADDMVSDEQIEVRLLLENEVFDSVREINKSNVNAKTTILNFEKEQTKIADKKYIIGNTVAVSLYIMYVIGIFMIGVYAYKKYDKEYVSDFYNEYYRELPASYPPAVMGYLYKFREIDDDDLTATLLDLIRRKYLILDAKGSSGVNDKNPDYLIKLNNEKSQDDLTESEKYLIRWFIKDIGNGEKVSSLQLKNYCDDYSSAIKYNECSKNWYKLVKAEAKKYNFFEKSIHSKKNNCLTLGVVLTIILSIVLLIISGYSGYSYGSILMFGSVCFAVALGIYINSIDKRTKKGNEDYVRWKAFKKFLEEFGSFEDYPVPSLIIWEHYLVYATSFGIADKVSEQLKLKLNLEEITSVESTFVIYFGLDYRIGRFNSTVRSMRTSSRSTITRYTAQRTGSSFGGRSGGGFSGGSSFGGGGGSFGGGRR